MAKPDPLDARFDDPVVQRRVLDRLRQIRAEQGHVAAAIGSLERDAKAKRKSTDPAVGTSKMELRNWVVSLVESVAYVEWQVGVLSAVTVFGELLDRMCNEGWSEAYLNEGGGEARMQAEKGAAGPPGK